MFCALESLYTAEQTARQEEESLVWKTEDNPNGIILRSTYSCLLLSGKMSLHLCAMVMSY